jgi:hypothetical protein
MEPDTLQRIAAAVTPAVMVSACGLIALGLDNQAGRLGTRMREMMREWRALDPIDPRRALVRTQVVILGRRHHHLTRALTADYAALLAFVLTSMLYLAAPVLGLPRGLPLVSFTVGVLMLGAVAVFALFALRLSRDAIVLEQAQIGIEEGAG